MTEKTLGQIAYEAHKVCIEFSPPVELEWNELEPIMRDRYENRAQAVFEATKERCAEAAKAAKVKSTDEIISLTHVPTRAACVDAIRALTNEVKK